MSLEKIQSVYEALGRDDPLWAILTDDRFRGNKWDPREFFRTGQTEIEEVFCDLEAHHLDPRRGCAVDFGCGVGRLTQALCTRFDSVIGVDISSTMIDRAVKWNQYGNRCRYLVNTSDALIGIADGSVDFVYSNISLQHNPPRYQMRYIEEFLRVLRPGGLAAFQVRIGPHRPQGSLSERWYRLKSETLRPVYKRLRGRPAVQAHTVSEQDVHTAVGARGTILYTVNTDRRRRASRQSLRYVVQKLEPDRQS